MRSAIAQQRFLLGAITTALLCNGCATNSKTPVGAASSRDKYPAPAEVAASNPPANPLADRVAGSTTSSAATPPPDSPQPVKTPDTTTTTKAFRDLSDRFAEVVPNLNEQLEDMGLATGDTAAAQTVKAPRPLRGSDNDPFLEDPCDQSDSQGVLDNTQQWVFQSTCRTAAWFDGFFGTGRADARAGNTFGRIGLSGFWDQRDAFDAKFRFRAKFALPALSERGSFMIGKGDEEEFIDERTTSYDTIPGNFNNIDDDSFLVGLGYAGGKDRNFKISIGAKVRAPPEPFIKLRYRKYFPVTDSTMIRVRPIVYWKSEDKFGSTLRVDLDQLLSNHVMLRWSNYGNVAQGKKVEGLEWESSLFLFHALSNRKALTYRLMLLGKTDAEVPLENYGFEFRFRRRIYRKWLFLELLSSVTWPKEYLTESRDVNYGVGIGLEMYFGPVPDRKMY